MLLQTGECCSTIVCKQIIIRALKELLFTWEILGSIDSDYEEYYILQAEQCNLGLHKFLRNFDKFYHILRRNIQENSTGLLFTIATTICVKFQLY